MSWQPLPILGVLLGVLAPAAHALECNHVLPPQTEAITEWSLCKATLGEQARVYACREVAAGQRHYRVLFRGGATPHAIFRLDGAQERLVWSRASATPVVCAFTPPDPVPALATFQGAGVCDDAKGQPVPCSVFRHRVARTSATPDYLVLHDAAGGGPIQTTVAYRSDNPDALTAEFAYQIGLVLLRTRCCQLQGLAYLEEAYRLFPRDRLYREAYRQGATHVAARETP